MKKLILVSFLALTASLAYAGSGCGGCGGDKKDGKDKKTDASEYQASSVVLAKSCGGCGGDKKDEKAEKTGHSASLEVYAGDCGGGCDKDKKKSA